MKWLLGFLALCCSAALFPFGGIARAAGTVPVAVSIPPQKYFVEKIGGRWVAVSVMVEPGANPHNYEPKPQQMIQLAAAKIYFAVGDPFEKVWLRKFAAANPAMLIVNTEQGIRKLPMDSHGHGEEAPRHGKSGKKEAIPEGLDPHVWLSPPLVMLQARNILDAFLRVDPEHRSDYEANYARWVTEIVQLDLYLLEKLSRRDVPREFMVFHPSWGYFAGAYGLKQLSVEVEGKEPKAAELKELIRHAKERNIRSVFVQPQFSGATAKVIAEAVGGRVVMADPLAEDWDRNLREMGDKLSAALP
ncbi:MAG TPA: zinc ABC transporter substrate-binding protein [Syntrophobacteraceae bacterium]|nr:zinc ABC transporter substrate-binding protein [Syntrophobacteraceae bacterium]